MMSRNVKFITQPELPTTDAQFHAYMVHSVVDHTLSVHKSGTASSSANSESRG